MWTFLIKDAQAKTLTLRNLSSTVNKSILKDKAAWTRVRHVPAGNTFHPAKDLLNGTEEYGNPSDDTKAWSIKWDKS